MVILVGVQLFPQDFFYDCFYLKQTERFSHDRENVLPDDFSLSVIGSDAGHYDYARYRIFLLDCPHEVDTSHIGKVKVKKARCEGKRP